MDQADTPTSDAATTAPQEVDRTTPAARWRSRIPAAVLLVLLALGVIGYTVVLHRFDVAEVPLERQFGETTPAGADAYLQFGTIDAANQSVQFHVRVRPPPAAAPDGAHGELLVTRPNGADRVTLPPDETGIEFTRDIDLSGGSIRAYPLDRFSSSVDLSYVRRAADGTTAPVPLRVTVWEGGLGWSAAADLRTTGDGSQLHLDITFARTGAVRVLGITIYLAMAALALCALAIGALTFLGIRKPEAAFVGALGAMVFALPALRGVLPGAPPLGIRADVLVFFWAELAVAIALLLTVMGWVRTGPPP